MDFVDVELDGVVWEVASTYFPHVTIGEAADLAKQNGCELPSPRLVDAIWAAADLKLRPLPRNHDGTPRTMASPEVYADQEQRIAEQIRDTTFTLVAGCYKDVVRVFKNALPGGALALYGWHVQNGVVLPGIPLHPCASGDDVDAKVIQPVFTGHSASWGDYSQGARLVRRKA